MTRGAFERDQRTHAVANDYGLVHPRSVLHCADPFGELTDACERGPVAAAMAGKIDGEHAKAVVREIAALQNPYAVVALGAVDEDHGGQCCVERLAAGVGVSLSG